MTNATSARDALVSRKIQQNHFVEFGGQQNNFAEFSVQQNNFVEFSRFFTSCARQPVVLGQSWILLAFITSSHLTAQLSYRERPSLEISTHAWPSTADPSDWRFVKCLLSRCSLVTCLSFLDLNFNSIIN